MESQYKDRWRADFSSLAMVFKYPKNMNPKLKCLVFDTDLVINQLYSAGKFAWNFLCFTLFFYKGRKSCPCLTVSLGEFLSQCVQISLKNDSRHIVISIEM